MTLFVLLFKPLLRILMASGTKSHCCFNEIFCETKQRDETNLRPDRRVFVFLVQKL